MLLSFVSRRLSLLMLAVSAVLASMVISTSASANWMRDYTPSQFCRLEVVKKPIDRADFSDSLLAAAIFQETNQQRADLKLPAFLPDEQASEAARLHARWMAGNHRLTHDEPSARGMPLTSYDRLVQQGLRPHFAAENIANNLVPDITPGRLFYTRPVEGRPVYSYQPGGSPLQARTYKEFAQVILAQWMHSPLHRAHIVDPKLHFLGVGVSLARRRGHPDAIYAAQDFFTPHTLPSDPAADSTEATLSPQRP